MNAPKLMMEVVLLVAAVVLFKPLLLGLAKALWLTVHPRLSKEEKLARRQMRDAQLLTKLMNRDYGPSDAAELRALGARG